MLNCFRYWRTFHETPQHHRPLGSTPADYHYSKGEHRRLLLAKHMAVVVPEYEGAFRLRASELLLWVQINNDRGRRAKTLKCDRYFFVEESKAVMRAVFKVGEPSALGRIAMG